MSTLPDEAVMRARGWVPAPTAHCADVARKAGLCAMAQWQDTYRSEWVPPWVRALFKAMLLDGVSADAMSTALRELSADPAALAAVEGARVLGGDWAAWLVARQYVRAPLTKVYGGR